MHCAFYSPMMPKETHNQNFSKIIVGLVPPPPPPGNDNTRRQKLPSDKKKKNQNCPRALQVGSLCGEWRGEKMS